MANLVRDTNQTRYDLTDYISRYYDQLWLTRTKYSLYYKLVPDRVVRPAPKRMRDAFR
jgi:hypothetical protein